MAARLEKLYRTKLRQDLKKKLDLRNIMEVPNLKKIVINTGVKDAVTDGKILAAVKGVIGQIAGQAAVVTFAKKSIAGFKIKQGMPIGVKVTLRRKKMYEFLDKLINFALPRVKDFQGVTTKLDGYGNYNLGIKDWMIFPEVDYDKVETSRGLNVTIETTSSKDEWVYELLKSFKMPFQRS